MAQCEAEVKPNKKCGEPVARGAKYCEKHKDFKPKVRSKADTGMGQGDTVDKTGKKQSHNMQAKGSGNSRVGK